MRAPTANLDAMAGFSAPICSAVRSFRVQKKSENSACNTHRWVYRRDMKTNWTLQMREQAQNSHFRQDRLCMYQVKPVIQATREEPAKVLPSLWAGHYCIGDITFKSLDNARTFAKEMGYEGIYL